MDALNQTEGAKEHLRIHQVLVWLHTHDAFYSREKKSLKEMYRERLQISIQPAFVVFLFHTGDIRFPVL